jgi:hypothetical protein
VNFQASIRSKYANVGHVSSLSVLEAVIRSCSLDFGLELLGAPAVSTGAGEFRGFQPTTRKLLQ